MNEKIISLRKHKLDEAKKVIEEAAENSDLDFEHVTDEYLDYHAKHSDVSKSDMLKTVWMLAKRMDEIETEFLKFKINIAEIVGQLIDRR